MRGKVELFVLEKSNFGITPAHAGKSDETRAMLKENGDHPRTCGEKDDGEKELCEYKGSPPHMRGKD